MAATDLEKARVDEVIRLLEVDSQRTSAFIESIVGRGFTIRGWGITVALALIGVGFDREQWEFGVLSLIVTLLFLWVDAQHASLYTQALEHSQELDTVLGHYYTSLTRGVDDPEPKEQLAITSDALRYGYSTSLKRFEFKSFWQLKSRSTLIGIWGALALVSIVASVAVGVSASDDGKAKFSCAAVPTAPTQYECVEK